MSITVTAHTGAQGTADNSTESILKASQCGADIAEMDVTHRVDGTPVMTHKTSVVRSGGVPLDEGLAAAAGTGLSLNLDLKRYDGLDAVYELIVKHGLTQRVLFTGVCGDGFAPVRESCPGIPYYYNMSAAEAAGDPAELAQRAVSLGCAGINSDYICLNAANIAAFHEAGLLVSAWTVNSVHDMKRLISLGVDNITTKKVLKLRGLLDEAGDAG